MGWRRRNRSRCTLVAARKAAAKGLGALAAFAVACPSWDMTLNGVKVPSAKPRPARLVRRKRK